MPLGTILLIIVILLLLGAPDVAI